LLLSTATPALCASEPLLYSDASLSTEGYFVINWEGFADTGHVLQQSRTTDFREPVSYDINAAGSMTLSGYKDGIYLFRAGESGNWSDTLRVEVKHHSLAKALGFFALGLLLFIILCAVVIRGARHSGESDT
jgi:hypothetical protein